MSTTTAAQHSKKRSTDEAPQPAKRAGLDRLLEEMRDDEQSLYCALVAASKAVNKLAHHRIEQARETVTRALTQFFDELAADADQAHDECCTAQITELQAKRQSDVEAVSVSYLEHAENGEDVVPEAAHYRQQFIQSVPSHVVIPNELGPLYSMTKPAAVEALLGTLIDRKTLRTRQQVEVKRVLYMFGSGSQHALVEARAKAEAQKK